MLQINVLCRKVISGNDNNNHKTAIFSRQKQKLNTGQLHIEDKALIFKYLIKKIISFFTFFATISIQNLQGAVTLAFKMAFQIFKAFNIVRSQVQIGIWKGGCQSGCRGLKAGISGQRIEPYHFIGPPMD